LRMGKDGPIRAETPVGDIVRLHPALREKFGVLFGAVCLSCKSSRHESVTYTSWHRDSIRRRRQRAERL
jgi:hypothetical protein